MTTYHELSIDKLFRLDGEVALVTGGGDGFGRIASMTYANAGASVAVTDIDKTKADAVVAESTDGGGHTVALELDV
ncbi:MAG: SDR family NAD(P)-dependent oxidoreductase, partial [Rhodospirillaceae bacterium TMED63]